MHIYKEKRINNKYRNKKNDLFYIRFEQTLSLGRMM